MMNNSLGSRVLMLIANSPWLEPFGDYHLRLDDCTSINQVYERVFVNVSARIGAKWKDVYYAKESQPELFAELIVCLILIRRTVLEHFDYREEDIEKLIGHEFHYLVENYFSSIEKK